MLTTVASSEAIPEPSTVTNSTHRPGAEEYERAGASAVVIWEEGSRVSPPTADRRASFRSVIGDSRLLAAIDACGDRAHPDSQMAHQRQGRVVPGRPPHLVYR